MAKRDNISWIAPEPIRRTRSMVAVLISLAILVAGVSLVSWKGYGFYMDVRQQNDYIGAGKDDTTIVIMPQQGWSKVGDNLKAAGVIKDPNLFVTEALKLNPGPFWPGTFKLKTQLPAKTAAEMLNDPSNRVIVSFTVPEGTRFNDIFPIMNRTFQTTQEQWDQAVAAIQADPSIIGLNQDAGGNPEGFLFPDTYPISPPVGTDPISIFSAMAAEFNNLATSIDLDSKAAAITINGQPLTGQQIVVVASIIEAEVNQSQYRPMVARAIYNRLAIGMPLRVESAFRYGRLMTDGTPYDDPITQSSQNDASLPYNYYINPGVPSTPIDMPGQDAINAALNPSDGDWLYWVTVNLDTGETKFASDEAGFETIEQEFHDWCTANGNPAGCQ